MVPSKAISDFYLYLDRPARSVVFRGSKVPHPIGTEDSAIQELAEELRAIVRAREGAPKFRVEHRDAFYRGQRLHTLDGLVYALRVLHRKSPELDKLGLPPGLCRLLESPDLKSGLFLFVGETGQGKTTTLTATLVQRLSLHHGMVLTVEDPIELFVDQDRIGQSLCLQVELDTDAQGSDKAFAEALHDSLRSFPASAGNHLVIGEIRTPEVAAMAVQSAIAGNIVLATLHANGVIEAIRRFVGLAQFGGLGAIAADMVSSALRVLVWQALPATGLKIEALVSRHEGSGVAAQIRAGKAELLSTEVERQNRLIRMNNIAALLQER
jgi:Tfp pilus assembly pilus retraction ATPase PilT